MSKAFDETHSSSVLYDVTVLFTWKRLLMQLCVEMYTIEDVYEMSQCHE
jgi:hypothetical protein